MFTVDGVVVATTPAGTNLYEGVYDPPSTVDVTISAGSVIRLDVFDEDLVTDDGAFACVSTAGAELLRSRDLSCSGALGSMLAVIVPI